MSSPIKVSCNASTDFLAEPFSFTIAYVNPDITGKRVGEKSTQLFIGHWPGDDESILTMVISNVDTTTLLILNAVIAHLPNSSMKISELQDCREEPNANSDPYASNISPIFDINTAARLVKVATKFHNPTDLSHLMWLTSWWESWRSDVYTWWLQLPSSGWRPPTSSEEYISKMSLCYWEPLGVFESCRTRILGWSNPRVDWTDAVAFRCTWEHLGAPMGILGAPGSTGNWPGSTSNHCRAVWEKQHLLWEHCWCAWK